MKKTVALLVAAMSLGAFAPALAQTSASPAPTTAAYDDASMHFLPPKDWQRLAVTPADLRDSDKLGLIAAYVHNPGRDNEQRMVLEMENFNGSSSASFESSVENELRTQFDGLLIRKQETHLANGMPAVWLNMTYGSGFDTTKLFGYAVSDGRRGIILLAQGRLDLIHEDEAKAALSSLSVVLYPRWRQ
ncbi:MAG: hypothetical protein M3126_06850 [Candidatus Eremiobacteraeota bacterium]|nr:hypothetical protein [Candidatus Eremiobacteraeota bacterium]